MSFFLWVSIPYWPLEAAPLKSPDLPFKFLISLVPVSFLGSGGGDALLAGPFGFSRTFPHHYFILITSSARRLGRAETGVVEKELHA